MTLRWVGWAAVGVAVGACGVISGLEQYSNTACGDGCDGGTVLSHALADGHAGPDATEDGRSAPDAGDDALEVANDGAVDAPNDVMSEAGCATGLNACDSGCVDTTQDTSNCGACGNTCSTGVANANAACVSSACTFTCKSGYSPCNGTCVDLGNTSNCGACGALCGGTTPRCSASSDGGTHACACARASDCPGGYACNGSVCTKSCSGVSACNGGCCSNGACAAGDAGSACGLSGRQCADCTTSNNGTACVIGGTGGASCGCNTNSDCSQGTCQFQHMCQF